MSTKKELILEGLCCANCASKIEDKVKKISGIEEVSLDFISRKLNFKIKEKSSSDRVIGEIKNIVNEIEPDVRVLDKAAENPKSKISMFKDNKNELIKIFLSIIIYASAFALKGNKNLQFVVYLIVYILIGSKVLLKAVKNIFRGQVFDENFLMAIATIGAFSIGQYPEGVAVMLLYEIGEFFQELAVERSRKSIASLMDIRPDYANVNRNNKLERVSPNDVKIGEIIIVKPGEKIPLDGRVVYGKSFVDTSSLTGESLLRNVDEGDRVLSGFVNKNGMLMIEVESEYSNSTVSKILEMAENAASKKAKTEMFITKFARYYTPIVVITAVFLAVLPPLLTSMDFKVWFYRALIFLVISCPCALVISIPLSFFAGIGAASKNGVLIKGSNYLEALNFVDTIIFDKTGTLTEGTFKVTKINTFNQASKDEVLKYAAYAESYSNHPIAKSILQYYADDIDKTQIKEFEEIQGYGIKSKIFDREVLVGNIKLLKNVFGDNNDYNNIKEEKSGTIIYVAVDGRYIGNIIIRDEEKKDSKNTIISLKNRGIKTVMLTGDGRNAAESVKKNLDIDECYFELLPNEKIEKLELIKERIDKDKKVVFVGDGVNDAPVLARADIGIAMGALGSDAAIEASDIVIMDDNPIKILTALKIAEKTKSIVWQNIIFALGVKVVLLVLGAFGMANMWEAVFGDVGVALIAIFNSLRAMKTKGTVQ
ncbi:Cd2+/Zn2+-exporting ATPase [Caloramator quimbayensis]|uniref:Cd(2+)-exporting ATPase n=1 Tax=Caloramator quimbayensis TaxID=1147123 RepID=A0A1T4XFT1_9CLOT|nr:heavy metal translocating P-type ATPase [Caloramator quimbayensis]SKA87941.1 Cd2+/Zn2+-exporting ATPase [Caloramator quimbayensis]